MMIAKQKTTTQPIHFQCLLYPIQCRGEAGAYSRCRRMRGWVHPGQATGYILDKPPGPSKGKHRDKQPQMPEPQQVS